MKNANAIDPRAGRHFEEIRVISVSKHAVERATEHFGIKTDDVRNWVSTNLRQATLIDADFMGEDGKYGRLFAYRGIAFVVVSTEAYVVTVYPQEYATNALRNEMAKVVARVLKAAQRKETREVKRVNIRKAELTVERAEMELRKLKTMSYKVVADCDGRIAEINEELKQLDAEIFELRREKATLAKGICAYV